MLMIPLWHYLSVRLERNLKVALNLNYAVGYYLIMDIGREGGGDIHFLE